LRGLQQRPRHLAGRHADRHFRQDRVRQVGDLHAADRRRHASLVTTNHPSYWHGWSPDGKELAYCGIRGDLFDIYTIDVTGGEERRLTHGEGRNDGPDYSFDGQWIYFNSSRTGLMQIWRIHPDGTGLEQVTHDDLRQLVRPSVARQRQGAADLLRSSRVRPSARQECQMRLMDMDGGNLTTLFELFGGQGTINVPNWSPGGDEFAYVRYFPASP
jgi:Tol biopolymer transport system component